MDVSKVRIILLSYHNSNPVWVMNYPKQVRRVWMDLGGGLSLHEIYLPDVPTPLERGITSILHTIDINTDIVKKKLSMLLSNKALGPDETHPKILKEAAEELCIPLKKIVKLSMDGGKVPEVWKLAKVTAIFKKGEKNMACNYRPVILTCIASNVLESIVRGNHRSHA